MIIRPLKKNVIVERIAKEEVSSGGIVLPGGDREAADKAVVLAIGPEVTDVKIGDSLLINWQKATLAGKEVYRINEEDIIGIFE